MIDNSIWVSDVQHSDSIIIFITKHSHGKSGYLLLQYQDLNDIIGYTFYAVLKFLRLIYNLKSVLLEPLQLFQSFLHLPSLQTKSIVSVMGLFPVCLFILFLDSTYREIIWHLSFSV